MSKTEKPITTCEFVKLLTGFDMKSARKKGIIEAIDELEAFDNDGNPAEKPIEDSIENPIERRAAARIIHEYMKKELGISDLEDISGAEVLKDLYDCRICVNHIAQVYLRCIMDEVTIEGASETLKIFDGKSHLTKAEALDILRRLEPLRP